MRLTLTTCLALTLALTAAPALAAEEGALCRALDGLAAPVAAGGLARYTTVTQGTGQASCETNVKDAAGDAFCAAAVGIAGTGLSPAYADALKVCLDDRSRRTTAETKGKFTDGKRSLWVEHVTGDLKAGPYLDLRHKVGAGGDQYVLALWMGAR